MRDSGATCIIPGGGFCCPGKPESHSVLVTTSKSREIIIGQGNEGGGSVKNVEESFKKNGYS